jgi:hypothetical protein
MLRWHSQHIYWGQGSIRKVSVDRLHEGQNLVKILIFSTKRAKAFLMSRAGYVEEKRKKECVHKEWQNVVERDL